MATTERPYAIVGEFAYLSVKAVNDVGAFLDWGLAKDLLVSSKHSGVWANCIPSGTNASM